MGLRRILASIAAALVVYTGSLEAADKKKITANELTQPSYELPQPDKERLDYEMYQRIREEALAHSHVMEYASGLMDGIGARLTGSPNVKRASEWTRDQFTAMGCSNAPLEDWGEFGMGWQQLNTWVRMTSPDTAVFIAQAAPWSRSTNGVLNAPAIWANIKEEKDFDKYKGKLAGKIVFLGEMREAKPVDKPLFTTLDDSDLKRIAEYPLKHEKDRFPKFLKKLAFREKVGQFLVSERQPQWWCPAATEETAAVREERFSTTAARHLGWFVYQREHANPLPIVVMAIENYGRVYRLLKAKVPVNIEINVDVKFTGDTSTESTLLQKFPAQTPR